MYRRRRWHYDHGDHCHVILNSRAEQTFFLKCFKNRLTVSGITWIPHSKIALGDLPGTQDMMDLPRLWHNTCSVGLVKPICCLHTFYPVGFLGFVHQYLLEETFEATHSNEPTTKKYQPSTAHPTNQPISQQTLMFRFWSSATFATLLAMIALSVVHSPTLTRIQNAILFIDTSNNAWYNNVHLLMGTPCLTIIASNALIYLQSRTTTRLVQIHPFCNL